MRKDSDLDEEDIDSKDENRETAKRWATLFQALADGETIERQLINGGGDEEWVSVAMIDTDIPLENYRIAEPAKCRPFKSMDEFIETVEGMSINYEDLPQPPTIWVRAMDGDGRVCLVTMLLDDCCVIGDEEYDYEELFKEFVFFDGSPCGYTYYNEEDDEAEVKEREEEKRHANKTTS